MGNSIHGVFPGGPRRAPHVAPHDVPTVMELAARADRGRARMERRRRSRRVRWGVGVTLVLAAGSGFLLGYLNQPDVEEVRRSAEVANPMDGVVSREVNRVLLELWKMEEGELGRGLRLGT